MTPTPLQKIWEIAPCITPEAEQNLLGYPPVLRQLLFNRSILDNDAADKFLGTTSQGHDPFLLTGMQKAVEYLFGAIDKGKSIIIYGDYDVDGVTSCALLVTLIRKYGASVRHYIPDRFEEGYGLNCDAVKSLAQAGTGLLVTVDCGIRSPREAKLARELGMDVIISDHHEPGSELPPAVAVICPKKPGELYPEKNLAGVGLAYKIAQAMLATRSLPGVRSEDFLDLVAVGTVADMMPLTGENRALVRAGLNQLRTRPRQGIFSLASVAGLVIKAINARDIGFMIGPRLNAAGRLDTANDAFHLLMASDVMEAGEKSQKLDSLNQDRQRQTRELVDVAYAQISESPDDLIHFAHMDDHISPEEEVKTRAGILGLVASRITESYYRPSIITCDDKGLIRASCRSIPEFNITKALDQCSDLLLKHGGHAMAAGFTTSKENLQELKFRLKTIADELLGSINLNPVLYADMEIPLRELKPEILQMQDQLEPTGIGNREAHFVSRGLETRQHRIIGKDATHLKLKVSDGVIVYDAVAFNQAYWAEKLPARVDILYKYELNNFQDRAQLQLKIQDMKLSDQV